MMILSVVLLTGERRMSRTEKRLQRWRENPPRDVPVEEVDAVVKRYFRQYHKKSGSHRVIRHPSLKNAAEYGPKGEFTFSVEGGQRVKRPYLRRLAEAIAIIEEIEND